MKPTNGSDVVMLIYGHCKPPTSGDEEGGCIPPIEIWLSPICKNLDVVASIQTWRRRSVRDAPVGEVSANPVLLTRRVQVKVNTAVPSDPQLAFRVLRALRSANAVQPVIAATGRIPAAPAAVLSGAAPCTP